ncbi:MAG: hypothetical protein ACYTBJ_05455, partial [Planctomycetota bacterium]
KETTLDSIENLPNFDDTRVSVAITDALPTDSFAYLTQFVPLLSRVRKILEETAPNPNREQIIDVLMQKLEDSAQGYRQVLSDFHKVMLEGGGSTTTSEPFEFQRREVYSGAAAYLLTELRAYRALPLMSKLYHCETHIPVSRLYVFYCMHLLAVDYPRAGLSGQAEKALDSYLQAAAICRQPPTCRSLTLPESPPPTPHITRRTLESR